MFLEALVYGKVTVLSPHPPLFPLLSAVFPTAGIPTVAPPLVRPTPRPDVIPPSVGTFLLYAQGQHIGYLPLSGTRLQKDTARTLLSLHVKISCVGRSCVGVQIWRGGGQWEDLRWREVMEDFWAAVCLHGPDTSTTGSGAPYCRVMSDQSCCLIGFMGLQMCGKDFSGLSDSIVSQGKTKTFNPRPQGSFNAPHISRDLEINTTRVAAGCGFGGQMRIPSGNL